MNAKPNLSKAAKRIIAKHGQEKAERAFHLHQVDGEGCYTVGLYLGVHWRTADGLINAGRELIERYDMGDAARDAACEALKIS